MHEHLEVVLPPTGSALEDVEQALAEFDENYTDEDGNPCAFWDWWVIGGRWSGQHILSQISDERMKSFSEDIPKYYVSGVQSAGWFYEKPVAHKDHPGDLMEVLLSTWRDHFPEFANDCPFWGLTDQYRKEGAPTDIARVGDLSSTLACSRLLIYWRPEEKLKALRMLQESFWNGVTHVESKWDGSVVSAIEDHNKVHHKVHHRRRHAARNGWWEEYGSKQIVRDDWVAVTVDYHS